MPLQLVFNSTQLTLGNPSTGSFFETTPLDDSAIRRLLNSASEREKENGMRAILAKIAEGKSASEFFADVVKNMQSRDLSVLAMVASYLVLYSDREPDLALMAVNSVQRMLSDSSAVVRLQAIRFVSALRVSSVAPIVTHFIRDLVNDVSPLVRIACCQATGKCHELDPSLGPELLNVLASILRSPRQLNGDFAVAGWALAVIAVYWPQRLDLVHTVFRTYVPHLASFDEWCQITVCRMLVRYCRHYMTGPEDADCRLFVEALEPLMFSHNDAVVIEAAAAVLYVGTEADFARFDVAQRLIQLKPTTAVWSSIVALCAALPDQFQPHRSHIILGLMPSDPPELRVLVLKTALLCQGAELRKSEISHLKFCALAWQNNQPSVRAAMETLAALCGSDDAPRLARWLIGLASSSSQSPALMSEALMVLRVLVQQHKLARAASTLARLSELATKDKILPEAKATIMWLLGTHCTDQPALATNLLRTSLTTMAVQAPEVRLEIVQLAAKVYNAYRNDSSQFDERVPQFFAHAIHLARYDPEIDVRDRARMFGALLSQDDNTLATLLLQAIKPPPLSGDAEVAEQQPSFVVGTASAYFGKRMDGYVDLENWGVEDTSAARSEAPYDPEQANTVLTTKPVVPRASATALMKKMSLEEFLNTPETSDSSSEDEDEGGDEDEEDSEAESAEEDDDEEGSDSESETNSKDSSHAAAAATNLISPR